MYYCRSLKNPAVAGSTNDVLTTLQNSAIKSIGTRRQITTVQPWDFDKYPKNMILNIENFMGQGEECADGGEGIDSSATEQIMGRQRFNKKPKFHP